MIAHEFDRNLHTNDFWKVVFPKLQIICILQGRYLVCMSMNQSICNPLIIYFCGIEHWT